MPPASLRRILDHRITLVDIVAAYGLDAVVSRIASLHAVGRHYAARAIEAELSQLYCCRNCR
ncbi:hypothetical protein IU459_03355 [Nocardia amamiensis]|uniref:Uncharacterized protein n=1 Tax=Nocardia amamiensis TaxID=404578 RepID=A0ABS0CJ00_9NOCA|nr:hypothetical protein [Nocardia amamiensis]MBF6296577.1 hypothetical protein [Nocardia amamiensis]